MDSEAWKRQYLNRWPPSNPFGSRKEPMANVDYEGKGPPIPAGTKFTIFSAVTDKPYIENMERLEVGDAVYLKRTSTGNSTLYVYGADAGDKVGWVPSDYVDGDDHHFDNHWYVGRVYKKHSGGRAAQIIVMVYSISELSKTSREVSGLYAFIEGYNARRPAHKRPLEVPASIIRTVSSSKSDKPVIPSTAVFYDDTSEKETIMSAIIDRTVNTNKKAMQEAAYLEAGRIANNQLAKLAAKQLPLMVRGYAEHAIGKFVIANGVVMAVGQLRPNDPKLAHLAQAMLQQAYVEVYQTLDIEGLINKLLDSDEIKKAMDKLGSGPQTATRPDDQQA